jgi:hypothetical protein
MIQRAEPQRVQPHQVVYPPLDGLHVVAARELNLKANLLKQGYRISGSRVGSPGGFKLRDNVGALDVESSLPIAHNLHPFKPITYNLSSENPVSKFAFQMQPAPLHNVYSPATSKRLEPRKRSRYLTARLVVMTLRPNTNWFLTMPSTRIPRSVAASTRGRGRHRANYVHQWLVWCGGERWKSELGVPTGKREGDELFSDQRSPLLVSWEISFFFSSCCCLPLPRWGWHASMTACCRCSSASTPRRSRRKSHAKAKA